MCVREKASESKRETGKDRKTTHTHARESARDSEKETEKERKAREQRERDRKRDITILRVSKREIA